MPSETDWYTDETATFGDRVVAAREAVGLTAEELARRMGIQLRTVEAWEADRIEPRANRLQMMAGILNVSLRWLLTGEGTDGEAPRDGARIEPDLAELLTELRTLRGAIARNAEALGRLEKRLQSALREPA